MKEFLPLHENVQFPLHADLFELAEPGLALVEQDGARFIDRGIFTSTPDLGRKPLRYIRQHDKHGPTHIK